jgi:hypothetical protein
MYFFSGLQNFKNEREKETEKYDGGSQAQMAI